MNRPVVNAATVRLLLPEQRGANACPQWGAVVNELLNREKKRAEEASAVRAQPQPAQS